jgi:hypothetical protein
VSLPWVYMPDRDDSPKGSGLGILLLMDRAEEDFVRRADGRWTVAGWETSDDPITWGARAVRDLLRKNWIEIVSWDERMAPTRVKRSSKPGHYPDPTRRYPSALRLS